MFLCFYALCFIMCSLCLFNPASQLPYINKLSWVELFKSSVLTIVPSDLAIMARPNDQGPSLEIADIMPIRPSIYDNAVQYDSEF